MTRLRSAEITDGPQRTGHRALLFADGLGRADLGKPLIAVVNSWNEIVPGCLHLPVLSQAVHRGIRRAGGVPLEFNTIAVCDGLAQGHAGMRYSLPRREIIAASAEIMLQAHCFDGAVFVASCDKVTPGMLLAAARVDLPSVFLTAGPMATGRWKDQTLTLASMRECAGRFHRGEITGEELACIEEVALPGAGTCAMLGTANTMACLTEAMGLTLPASSTTPALSAAKAREADRAGQMAVELVGTGQTARAFLSIGSLRNALRVGMAIGGSTNLVLHLLALAQELGLDLDLRHVDEISRTTPYLSCLVPSGSHTLEDLDAAGGISAVMQSIAHLLDLQVPTVTGRPLSEVAAQARWVDRQLIRPAADPVRTDGGLGVLWGSLAPEGALVKRSAVEPCMWIHTGPALVFDQLEDAVNALLEDRVVPGSVLVLRYEGPVGGPGMREMHMITSLMAGMGLASNTALVTDGRFSGSTRGACIGYVSPEAALGGPIALVQDGDLIAIDIGHGVLELQVSDTELERRRAGWQPRPVPEHGVLGLMARLATSANRGAVWRWR
jgi:dihydroxy-acid dehydratase